MFQSDLVDLFQKLAPEGSVFIVSLFLKFLGCSVSVVKIVSYIHSRNHRAVKTTLMRCYSAQIGSELRCPML